jgi:hypothetical protein
MAITTDPASVGARKFSWYPFDFLVTAPETRLAGRPDDFQFITSTVPLVGFPISSWRMQFSL